ncbi:MAG: TatD family hydrolase [Clostridiaceae bacterium]|nr:TatD family hydrolase [Clostridiaceae bacterium]
MIFDTHAHYDDAAFDQDRDALLQGMKEQGVGQIVDIGADIASTERAVALSGQYPFVYAAAGVHPSETAGLTEEDMDFLCRIAKKDKVVAIGEIGLDYHYDEPDKEIQQKWFRRQLDLAKQLGLPVVIHSREAAQDTLSIMREEQAKKAGGVIHCFSYGWDMAQCYLDMGFYLGVGGVVTFKNGRKLKEVVEKAPIERLVLETDAPYLAPEPFRGKRNQSAYLSYVAEQIAALKDMTAEEVIRVTGENARAMYRIQD